MPITAEQLKNWAQGRQAPPEEETAVPGDDMDLDLEGGEEGGELNAAWAGEALPEEMEPEELEELSAWLSENEPDIYAAMEALEAAFEEMDELAMDEATTQLLEAPQYLVPRYAEFDEEQRTEVAEQIRAGVPIPDAVISARGEAPMEEGEEDLEEEDEEYEEEEMEV